MFQNVSYQGQVKKSDFRKAERSFEAEPQSAIFKASSFIGGSITNLHPHMSLIGPNLHSCSCSSLMKCHRDGSKPELCILHEHCPLAQNKY